MNGWYRRIKLTLGLFAVSVVVVACTMAIKDRHGSVYDIPYNTECSCDERVQTP